MMAIEAPTILGSQTVQGISQSSVPGNLVWSDDGQAAFCTSRGVHILTPHIHTSLPSPPAWVEAGAPTEHPSFTVRKFMRGEKTEDDAMEGTDENGQAGPYTSRARRIRTPHNGEVGWYVNGVDTKETDRTELYDWTTVGEESSAIVSEGESSSRSVAWSPSGLSDLGSCLQAIMNTEGQVSVYAPSGDPYTKRWEEIADMTILARDTLNKKMWSPLTVPGMLHMRATCMQWSDPLPLEAFLGIDVSLFAIANRAGKVTFWSYGPERRFRKALLAEVTADWVVAMDWSCWTQLDNYSCTAKLSLACSDGSVAILHVRQTITIRNGVPERKVEIIKDEKVPDSDLRAINGTAWIDDMLVVARPGSITIWSPDQTPIRKWKGCKRFVLSQLGNWAGANPLSPCVYMDRIDPTSLRVTLSTQITYLIIDILTAPRLADPAIPLNLSIAARQILLDYSPTDMYVPRDPTKQERYIDTLTAFTGGWASMGEAGLVSWIGESVSYHTMDSSPDGYKKTTLIIADMGGFVPGRSGIMEDLDQLFENPPLLIQSSPLKILMPHLLRVIAAPDQVGICSEINEFLSSESLDEPIASTSKGSGKIDPDALMRHKLWGNRALDAMRLKYGLARWSAINFKASKSAFTSIAGSILGAIQSTLADVLSSPDTGAGADLCPACGDKVSMGDAEGNSKCGEGHEWSRCSITNLLISDPYYRICSACPAVSLLPPSCTRVPIPVDDEGHDKDHQRVAERGEMTKAEEMLEAAVICVLCGGRWARVF